MKRKNEFKAYLQYDRNSSNPDQYVELCERIERLMNKDMDELVISHEIVETTKNELKKHGSFKNTRAALHAYRDFVSSTITNTWIPMPFVSSVESLKTDPDICDLIIYENSVPTCDRISGLCDYLDNEYKKIIDLARDILKNIYQQFSEIPVYLSKECPQRTHFYDKEFLFERIHKICRECNREDCTPPYCPAFNVIWETASFTESIFGRFFGGPEPHIVIYFKNFNKKQDIHNKKYLSAIAKTLAHEYMHYLHYVFAEESFDLAVEELKEALADFFGVLYSIYRGGKCDIEVAKARYNTWVDRFGSGWPYAYALYFYKIGGKELPFSDDFDEYNINGCIEKLRKVFAVTPNATKAYDLLANTN